MAKRVADTALRRDGVVDAAKDRYAIEGRKLLSDHIGDYVAHCRHVGQAPRHVIQKERHLSKLRKAADATRLTDLTADALERHLRVLRDAGLSARTANFARQIAVAFITWCVKVRRLESNPLSVVPKLDESRDRRRVRRPLTDDELGRLLAVAEDRGRRGWYLAAAMAGLRKGDLQRLTWADVDFGNGTITVRGGKARREDVIPMHSQLADELTGMRGAAMAMPTAKVFAYTVTTRTALNDFLRAGLAQLETVTDKQGKPVMIGKGKRPKTRIVVEDEEGRVIDLHALRTTLGTNLARAGVAPQVAQRIMRHSDYRTTLRHYTVLGLSDTAKAIEALPTIQPDTREAATGTCDAHAEAPKDCRPIPRQLGRFSQRNHARRCDEGVNTTAHAGKRATPIIAGASGTMRRAATTCETAGDASRTRNIQLGRLQGPHGSIASARVYRREREGLYQCLYHAA